jgi:hypothetical protein
MIEVTYLNVTYGKNTAKYELKHSSEEFLTAIRRILRVCFAFSVPFFISHHFFRIARFRFGCDFQCFASKRNKRKNDIFLLRSENFFGFFSLRFA